MRGQGSFTRMIAFAGSFSSAQTAIPTRFENPTQLRYLASPQPARGVSAPAVHHCLGRDGWPGWEGQEVFKALGGTFSRACRSRREDLEYQPSNHIPVAENLWPVAWQ